MMARRPRKRRKKNAVSLPDLDQAKLAVLNTLSSTDAQRGYRHAIDKFIEWYCSEPRLSFNRAVVVRYRMHLEQRRLAPGTINLRLGAVRRLAYEGAEQGLLSPDLAAGIRRVRGLKKLGVRLGNWLTAEQAQNLWQAPCDHGIKHVRDRALLALLLSCGLRRHELVQLDLASLQQREDHWAVVDLEGKAGHMRTAPIPSWVKDLLDHWLTAASISEGRIFRRVNKAGKISECPISEKAVWHVVRHYATNIGLGRLAPHDLRRTCAVFATAPAVNWNRFSSCSATFRSKRRSAISAANSASGLRSMIASESSRRKRPVASGLPTIRTQSGVRFRMSAQSAPWVKPRDR